LIHDQVLIRVVNTTLNVTTFNTYSVVSFCSEEINVCGNGTCIDGNDTYICDCDSGFGFNNGTCLGM